MNNRGDGSLTAHVHHAAAPAGRRPSLAVSLQAAATLAAGLTMGGAVLPAIRNDLGLSLGAGAVIVSLPWGLFVVGALTSPLVSRRVGGARAVRWSMLLAAASASAVALFGTFAVLVVGLGLFALCGAIAHAVGSAVAADAQKSGRRNALLLVAVAWGAGAVGSPLIGSSVTGLGGSWQLTYGLVAISALSVTASAARGKHLDEVHQAAAHPAVALREARVRRGAVGLALYVGMEATIVGWTVTLLQGRGQSDGGAGAALSLFWAGVIGGRLALLAASNVKLNDRFIAVGAVSGGTGFLLLTQVELGDAVYLAAVATGLAVAGLFPAIVASGTVASAAVAGAVGFMIAAGGIGGIVLPWSVGIVAEEVGLSTALAFISAAPFAVAVLFAGRRRRP